MSEHPRTHDTTPEKERVLLVGIRIGQEPEWKARDSVEELARLVHTAGGEVTDQIVVSQKTRHPGYLIGTGKAEQIAQAAREQKADAIVFDEDLSPAQGRNLEKLAGCKVIDRTQVILDIFGMHAHSREGVMQVELARLSYLLPRLRRMWTHLERQQGGIGQRGGPGEQQIEVDRRIVMNKMNRIERDLKDVKRHRNEIRRGRRRHGWASIALVGYTNAGKSTLLNKLTSAEVAAGDALFVTLDTTTRRLDLPNQQPALLSDTVGFINKLPHHLVEAFKATLDEVIEADLLIHVADASSPQVDEQMDAVNRVLAELDIADKPTIVALNKTDTPAGEQNAGRLARLQGHAVGISARTGDGLDDLLNMVADFLREGRQEIFLRIPYADARVLASLKAHAQPLAEHACDDAWLIHARLPARLLAGYAHYRLDIADYESYIARIV